MTTAVPREPRRLGDGGWKAAAAKSRWHKRQGRPRLRAQTSRGPQRPKIASKTPWEGGGYDRWKDATTTMCGCCLAKALIECHRVTAHRAITLSGGETLGCATFPLAAATRPLAQEQVLLDCFSSLSANACVRARMYAEACGWRQSDQRPNNFAQECPGIFNGEHCGTTTPHGAAWPASGFEAHVTGER